MQLDRVPTVTRMTSPTGEVSIAVGLLLMDQPSDDGKTTGWYWTAVPHDSGEAQLLAQERWQRAIANYQGPYEDATQAIRGAEQWTEEHATLSHLLRQGATLVLSGTIAPDLATISDWIANHELLKKTRGKGQAPPAAGPDPLATPAETDNGPLLKRLREGEIPDRSEAEQGEDTLDNKDETPEQ